jgi:phospholipid/cholesterol/gamma-HCH transport system substrate-binding protein
VDRALELKVGAVLLAALLVLGGFVLLLGDVRFDSGKRIYVDYAFSGAVQAGAPVKISGVKVGRVERLEFLGGVGSGAGEDIQVRLVLFVEDRAQPVLREGARFYVNTQGLLGEHYVEIVPAERPGPPLAEGAVVRGQDPPRFDLLVQKVYDLLDAASRVLSGDQGELAELIKSGASLAKNLDMTLMESRGEVRRTVAAAAIAAEEASVLLRSVNQAVGDGSRLGSTIDDVAASTALVRKELPSVVEKLQKSLDDLRRLGETLDVVEPAQVANIVRHASSAAERADHVLADAQALTQRVRSGGGTVGLLLQDDEIYDDLKELLRDLKQHPWKLVWKQ